MTTNVSYLTGVRTRYVNILRKETQIGQELLGSSGDVSDETELIVRCNCCIDRLQLYSKKVENQTEKLAEAVSDSDPELINQLVSENESVYDRAMECVMNLKQLKDKISVAKVQKTEEIESHGLGQIVDLQKQMNAIVENQMKQQNELLEKQEVKEKNDQRP